MSWEAGPDQLTRSGWYQPEIQPLHRYTCLREKYHGSDSIMALNSNFIITNLFKYGLGEYLVLHIKDGKSILGKIVFEKGKMLLKDEGLLADFKPELLKPCWERGLIGMLCSPQNKTWESLSYYGLEKCDLPVDLESTRHGFLTAAQNQYGEKLIDFVP